MVSTNYGIVGLATRSFVSKIPITENYGAIQQYYNKNNFRSKIFGDEVISCVSIAITDEFTELPINFNGADWSITLQFDFLKPDPAFDIYGAPDPNLQPESGTRPENTLAEDISA